MAQILAMQQKAVTVCHLVAVAAAACRSRRALTLVSLSPSPSNSQLTLNSATLKLAWRILFSTQSAAIVVVAAAAAATATASLQQRAHLLAVSFRVLLFCFTSWFVDGLFRSNTQFNVWTISVENFAGENLAANNSNKGKVKRKAIKCAKTCFFNLPENVEICQTISLKLVHQLGNSIGGFKVDARRWQQQLRVLEYHYIKE